jgi:hypothetical protein
LPRLIEPLGCELAIPCIAGIVVIEVSPGIHITNLRATRRLEDRRKINYLLTCLPLFVKRSAPPRGTIRRFVRRQDGQCMPILTSLHISCISTNWPVHMVLISHHRVGGVCHSHCLGESIGKLIHLPALDFNRPLA